VSQNLANSNLEIQEDSPLVGLEESNDNAWTAKCRRLQGWYRETILNCPPGIFRGKKRDNHLPKEAVDQRPDLNFITRECYEYFESRSSMVKLDDGRARQNLLSSQPMCFNIFGHLRTLPVTAASLFSRALSNEYPGLPSTPQVIEIMEVEWIPDEAHPLNDGTAFDAFIDYRIDIRDNKGRRLRIDRGFYAVETKYTESFTKTNYDRPRYHRMVEEAVTVFGIADSAPRADNVKLMDRLFGMHNQLLRNILLTNEIRRTGRYDYGHVLVIAPQGDLEATAAVNDVSMCLKNASSILLYLLLEKLIQHAVAEPLLKEWAYRFHRRYLDFSPIDRPRES